MATSKEIFTITYEMSVDTDTGKVLETKIIDKSFKKQTPPKKDSSEVDEEPKLYLEETKYRLNNKAAELLSIEPGSKLEIVYSTNGPQIQESENGNKVTKALTVQFKGKKNEELKKFGEEFVIKDNNRVYILDSGIQQLTGDDNISIEEEVEDLPFDLSLDELDNKDANITEIDSNFFKL